jgi:hypothetical protein
MLSSLFQLEAAGGGLAKAYGDVVLLEPILDTLFVALRASSENRDGASCVALC